MMIDGNNGSHRHSGRYDSIRECHYGNGIRTEGRPERRVLRGSIFRKDEINETRVVNPVFLDRRLSARFRPEG